MTRSWTFVLTVAVVLSSAAVTIAAVVSGNIEAVSAGAKSITVRVESLKTSKSYKLASTAKITIDGKPGALDDVKTGQTATITTDAKGELATKVAVRTMPSAPVSKPAAKPERPKAAPKSTEGDRTPNAAPGDWPQHRGPNRDNISRETGLLKEWPESGPPVVWQADGIGEGYSAVSVVGDTIYTAGTRDQEDALFALDDSDGRIKWSTPLGRKYENGTGDGPRGTPTVDGDRVYALGGNGDLVCANAETGEVVWRQNILKEYGGNNITWGISESVLIDDDRLICTPGGRQATMVALNKLTGRPIWRSAIPGNPSAAYSSPIIMTVGNVRQYVNFVHTAVVGVRATDGEPLWGQQASVNSTANCSTPVAANNVVFTASGYGTGGALFRLASAGNATQAEVAFTTKQMKNHHGGMVLIDGFLYGFDEAVLTCLDLRSGQSAWQNRSVGKGSLTAADGGLYLRSENGPVALATISPQGYEERSRFEPSNRSQKPAWSHPVIAHGRLYLRDQNTLVAYDIKAK
jgi:outer membrane protein assembly factor BamB